MERALGDVQDGCTRNHRRKRLANLVAVVEEQLQGDGPWTYKRSAGYDEAAIAAMVENTAEEKHAKDAA